MPSFEEQKLKYQSVLNQVEAQGIKVANLHQQEGKLFIKGTAPSLEAANKIWDEIKRINPRLDDIIADFPVDPSLNSNASKNVRSQPQTSGARIYTVQQGDTLSKLSQKFYGNANDYMKIFNANKDKLKDPNRINVGQELKIPAA